MLHEEINPAAKIGPDLRILKSGLVKAVIQSSHSNEIAKGAAMF
jgi:hypothetical protein